MDRSVIRDWNWADGYLPEIRRILSENALRLVRIEIASYQMDISKATDFLVNVSGNKAIAVRLRRNNYWQRDLTIRSSRESGVKTELEKIKEGYGDFYLYGWTSDHEIKEWMLVDLDALRKTPLLQRPEIRNKDLRTAFIAISFNELKANQCVVSSQVRPVDRRAG